MKFLTLASFLTILLASMATAMEESSSSNSQKELKNNAVKLDRDYIKKDFVQAKKEFSTLLEHWKSIRRSHFRAPKPIWNKESDIFNHFKDEGLSFLFPRALQDIRSDKDSIKTNKQQEEAAVGDTVYRSNPIIDQMLEDAEEGKLFLDVGSSYGVNTFKLLKKGAMVIANDSDPDSLVKLAHRSKKRGWGSQLFIIKGYFPNDVDIADNSLDGILMSYVIHYLKPEEIEQVFKVAYRLLRPGGKLYITSLSPYSKTFDWFTAESLKRFIDNNEWPGQIKDCRRMWRSLTHLSTQRFHWSLPNYMHPQYPEVLAREARKANFDIEKAIYYSFSNPKYVMRSINKNGLEQPISYRFFKEATGLIAIKRSPILENKQLSPLSESVEVETKNRDNIIESLKLWANYEKSRPIPGIKDLQRINLDNRFESELETIPFKVSSDSDVSDASSEDVDSSDNESDEEFTILQPNATAGSDLKSNKADKDDLSSSNEDSRDIITHSGSDFEDFEMEEVPHNDKTGD